jgi:hypothetical protein
MQRFGPLRSLTYEGAKPVAEDIMSMRGFAVVTSLAALAVCAVRFTSAMDEGKGTKGVDRAASVAAFERIKKLEGSWRAQSTKGWGEKEVFHVIARGSAVVVQSAPAEKGGQADVAPNAPMLTVYHLDGDRLMLTHYCEAGNQPRMVANNVDENGRTVYFSFLDATNMRSSSSGHMHSVVMTFVDENHFSERWSWYVNGKEQWMETVENARVNP